MSAIPDRRDHFERVVSFRAGADVERSGMEQAPAPMLGRLVTAKIARSASSQDRSAPRIMAQQHIFGESCSRPPVRTPSAVRLLRLQRGRGASTASSTAASGSAGLERVAMRVSYLARRALPSAPRPRLSAARPRSSPGAPSGSVAARNGVAPARTGRRSLGILFGVAARSRALLNYLPARHFGGEAVGVLDVLPEKSRSSSAPHRPWHHSAVTEMRSLNANSHCAVPPRRRAWAEQRRSGRCSGVDDRMERIRRGNAGRRDVAAQGGTAGQPLRLR